MSVNDARSCASCCPFSDGPLGQDALSSNHAQRRGYISDHPDLSPHDTIPIPVATTLSLPSEDITFVDPESSGELHLGHAQQPPGCIIDYWFHYLGLSLDT